MHSCNSLVVLPNLMVVCCSRLRLNELRGWLFAEEQIMLQTQSCPWAGLGLQSALRPIRRTMLQCSDVGCMVPCFTTLTDDGEDSMRRFCMIMSSHCHCTSRRVQTCSNNHLQAIVHLWATWSGPDVFLWQDSLPHQWAGPQPHDHPRMLSLEVRDSSLLGCRCWTVHSPS